MNKVIVIGAGISGLVAAYELQKNNIDVMILESSSRVGGRMISDEVDDCIIDGGAQFLSSGYPIITSLIDELKLSSNFIETSPYVGIIRDAKICKYRYDKPFSLLSGGVLKFKEWLSLGFGGFKLQKEIKNLPTNDYSAWSRFDNENTQVWSDDFYTKGVTDYFIEPMLEAFYFQSPIQTSKALPMALAKFSLDKAKTKTLKGGIGILAQELSKNLDIRFDAVVENIECRENQVIIKTKEELFKASKIIITVPAPITKTFYVATNKYEARLLNTNYSTTINIAIALKDSNILKNIDKIYGIWIPKCEREIISAITIESSKSQDRTHKGELLNIMLSGEAGKKMIDKEDKEILSSILKEAEKYIPQISNNIRFSKIFRWKYAEPISYIGRAKDIKEYKENLEKDSLIYLAGDYMSMPFTEGAAQSGKWVASRILKHNKARVEELRSSTLAVIPKRRR